MPRGPVTVPTVGVSGGSRGRAEVVGDVGWDGMGWGAGWMMAWGWLFLVVLVVGVVLLAVVLVRLLSGGTGRGPDGGAAGGPAGPVAPSGRAREILDERYARGEIDAAEYAERLRVLREGR